MRWMGRIALVAMLLLVALPTLGRLAGRAPVAMAMPMPASMAMPMPAAAVDAPAHCHEAPGAPRPAHGDDCDYCPLLAGLALPAVAAPLPMVAPPPRHVPPAATAAVLPVRHPAGLGSRGPPAAA